MNYNKNPWEKLNSRTIYDNPWITVEEHDVVNPKGGNGIYGKVHFKNKAIGVIPIDSSFSPIKRIQYIVSQARVGQQTDYDRLTLEIETDGSVTPESSLAYAAKILKEQMEPRRRVI